MISRGTHPGILLRQLPEKRFHEKPEDKTEDKTDVEISDDDQHILCRQCLLIITRETERIAVNGTHQHACANPHGIVFEIGCFRSAVGCRHVGPSSNEWSWFPGFNWKIAVCHRCLIHLGWFFARSTPDRFYGFILNRLITAN